MHSDHNFARNLVAKKPRRQLKVDSVIRGCMPIGLDQHGPDRRHIGGMGGDDRDRCLSREGGPIVPPNRPVTTSKLVDW